MFFMLFLSPLALSFFHSAFNEGHLARLDVSPVHHVCDLPQTQVKYSSALSLSLSPPLTQHGPKLSLYLFEMLHDHKDSLTKDEQNAVGVFMTSLKLCGHRCIPPNVPHRPELLKAINEASSKGILIKSQL